MLRGQGAQHLTQRLGIGAPQGGLEAPLSLRPQGIGFGELRTAPPRERYQPISPIVWIDCDSDKTVALQRLQCVGERSGVHHQRLRELADRGRLRSSDLSEDRALRRLQAARGKSRVVELRDTA